MGSSRLVVLVVLLSACASGRQFDEPSWGNAPSPSPLLVAEITLEHLHCADHCRSEQLVLTRDGQAVRSFGTRQRTDSFFVARVDSASFERLAAVLVHQGFFRLSETGPPPPLTAGGTTVSASVICRRKLVSTAGFGRPPATLLAVISHIDSVASRLPWRRCCGL